ncbi:MerR family transcriptional regulator [uncultured Clostridium sp.]|uniref:MerR family transcriptional regulator n=1 Tax=uncultured Clostridium sp. TaxID=59620 RepID=UPI0025EE8CEA|nr:MerR family transcriptional regulator [uncultured Clostridium sp.]
MDACYPIGETARRAGVTVETLRHYDRIGLIVPFKVDPQTGYRYYSDTEIAKVQIVHYLRSVNFSLPAIKKLFSEDDIPALTYTLRLAQKKVDEEIEHLLFVRGHLKDTLNNYSTKRNTRDFVRPSLTPSVQNLPARTVFLARGLHAPTLDNLMLLHDTVEGLIAPEVRGQFRFENAAGALLLGESCTLFAQCIRAERHSCVTTLPAGQYLCASCSTRDYRKTVEELRRLAADPGQPENRPVVLDIIFTGLIQWEYEVKLFLGDELPPQPGL